MVDGAGGDVFLLLPRVLLEGGALANSSGAMGLDLLIIGRLLEGVQVEEGGSLSKTLLLMGGRSPLKGTMPEQVLKKSSPFLADLSLVDWGAELFFTDIEMFVTFTLFFQLVG